MDIFNINDTEWGGDTLQYMLDEVLKSTSTVGQGCARVVNSKNGINIPRIEFTPKVTPPPKKTLRQRISSTRKVGMLFLTPLIQIQLLQTRGIRSKVVIGIIKKPIDTVDLYLGWLYWFIRFRIKLYRVEKEQPVIEVKVNSLSPKQINMFQHFNPKDFEIHFEAFGKDTNYGKLQPTVENFILIQYLKRIATNIDIYFWNSRLMFGDDITSNQKGYETSIDKYNPCMFDGWIYKALIDESVLRVPTVKIDFKNIRTVMDSMLKKISENVTSKGMLYKYGKNGLRFFMGGATFGDYETACTHDDFKCQDSNENNGRFRGYDIVIVENIPYGTIFLTIGNETENSNLYIGVTDVDRCYLSLKKCTPMGEEYKVQASFYLDVAYGRGDMIVLHTNIQK